MRLGRHSFAAGLFAGVAVCAGAVVILVVGGVVDTDALYVDRGASVQVWDTRGSTDRERWRPVNQREVDIAPARNIVVENGAIRLRWAGTPSNPLRFTIEPVLASSPASPAVTAPAAAYDPGPVRVSTVSSFETRLELSTPRLTQRAMVFAGYHGYATALVPARREPSTAAEIELGRFSSPMVVSDGVGVLVDRVDLTPAAEWTPMTAGRGYVIASAGSEAPRFVLSAGDAEIVTSSDGAGFAVTVRGRREVRAFVGSLAAAEPTGLFAPARKARAPSLAWVHLMRIPSGWVSATARPAGEASASLLLPQSGAGPTLEGLAEEGFSSLAAF